MIDRRKVLRGGAILMAAGAAGCAAPGLAVETTAAGTAAWRYRVDGGVRGLRSGPGWVVAASDTGLAGLEAKSGRELWRAAVDTPGIAQGACHWTNALVICETGPDGADRAVALDPGTGERKWSFDAPDGAALAGAFGVRDWVLYLIAGHAEGGREVWAVDMRTKTVRWRVPGATDGLVVPDSGTLLYSRSSGRGGNLAALDLDTGATVWSRDTGVYATSIGSGLVDGAVLVADGLHGVSGLDPKTGAALWATPTLSYSTEVLFGGGDAYYLCDGDKLHAMRPGGDAAPLWSLGVSAGGRAGNAGGYAVAGTFYLLADRILRAIEARTSKVLWMQAIPDKAGADVAFAVEDAHCYVESVDGDGSAVVALAR